MAFVNKPAPEFYLMRAAEAVLDIDTAAIEERWPTSIGITAEMKRVAPNIQVGLAELKQNPKLQNSIARVGRLALRQKYQYAYLGVKEKNGVTIDALHNDLHTAYAFFRYNHEVTKTAKRFKADVGLAPDSIVGSQLGFER